MKISTRKWLGGAILGASILGAALLFLSGAPFIAVRESHTQTFPDGSVTSSLIEVHWYVGALLVTGVTGLILLLIPGREKPNA